MNQRTAAVLKDKIVAAERRALRLELALKEILATHPIISLAAEIAEKALAI
jgi:hypothetical protein